MKVLHLLGSEEDTGGVLSTVRNIQEATRIHGCHHVAWVNEKFRPTREPQLDLRLSRHLVMETPNYFAFLVRGLRAFGELRQLLKREPCDVLHAHSRGPLVVVMLAALRSRMPSVFTNHAYARQRWFYWCTAHWPHLVTTVLTPRMAGYYRLTTKLGQVEVASECCADHFFQVPLSPSRPPVPTPRLRLVGIGNLIRWKNWDLVLKALALLPPLQRSQVEFHHFGPVPNDLDSQAYAHDLRLQVSESGLGEQVHFHGPTQRVESALRDADWFILPSANEPCSVALIEALALGIPALVTNSGGNPDIVSEPDTGALFTPNNPAVLADKLTAILDHRIVPAPPRSVRTSVESRSATVVGSQFLDIYSRTIKETFQ